MPITAASHTKVWERKSDFNMSAYRDEITRAMQMLSENEHVLFLGQTVGYPGSRFTYGTLEAIHQSRRIELPIMEETQMGICIGLALQGYIPVSVYPRFDFLLLALNQLINHLDKCQTMSQGQFMPKVIIRTIVGSTEPLHPGPQHCQDYTDALRRMVTNIEVVRLQNIEDIMPAYHDALEGSRSTVLIESGSLHS